METEWEGGRLPIILKTRPLLPPRASRLPVTLFVSQTIPDHILVPQREENSIAHKGKKVEKGREAVEVDI